MTERTILLRKARWHRARKHWRKARWFESMAFAGGVIGIFPEHCEALA